MNSEQSNWSGLCVFLEESKDLMNAKVVVSRRAVLSAIQRQADVQAQLENREGVRIELHRAFATLVSPPIACAPMPPDTLRRAFDPFFTTKEVGKGTGLGLSQVFGFVKQSRGHLAIYSEVGVGTTVKIYLPRELGALELLQQTSDELDLPRAREGERILVVEDEEAVRRLTVDTLRDLGYAVAHAASGEEALQQLDAGARFDLLFTDVVMPRMNGRELATKVQSRDPLTKVIYATGYTRNAIVHNGAVDPGVSLLTKPYTPSQLAARLRQTLDG